MLAKLSAAELAAINAAAVPGSEEHLAGKAKSSTAVPGSDESQWFKDVARLLLGKDAGLHLHYITGYPERSCYYYAKGERPLPGDFLHKLFRSPQGEPFLRAFMHGCEWWQQVERARRIAAQIDRLNLD